MKKTHKKLLGFVGLGLVAVTTTVAAALPAPGASAVTTSVTDAIRVNVVNELPDITITTESGSEISDPSFSFNVTYNLLLKIKATIVNKNDAGDVVFKEEIWNENLDGRPGSMGFDLNLDDFGGEGNFTITVEGVGSGDVPVERILAVKYKADPENKDPDGDGNVNVDVDIPDEKVSSVIVNVYDSNGNKVKTVNLKDPKAVNDVDLSNLPDGTYNLEIISKNLDGNVLNTEYRKVVIDRDGHADVDMPVEDVGQTIGRVKMTVKDKDGNTVGLINVNDPTPGDTIAVPLLDNLPAGIYTVTTDYYDPSNNLIKSVVTTFIKTNLDGHADVPVETDRDTVTTIETNIYDSNGNLVRIVKTDRATGVASIYDKDGNLLFTMPDAFKNGRTVVIPMNGLDSGDYTAVITFKNKYGRLVGNTKIIKIRYDAGGAIIVPDTGNFFQGLNISREDYLITGLIVFMVVGVVAFGVVKRKRH